MRAEPIIIDVDEIHGVLDQARLDQLRALMEQLTGHGMTGGMDFANDVIANPDNLVFLATQRTTGMIVGVAMLTILRTFTRTFGYVNDVVVDADYRRHGVGRMLCEAMIAMGKQQGCGFLDLTTSPARQAAHNLYTSMGFKPLETQVCRLDLRDKPTG